LLKKGNNGIQISEKARIKLKQNLWKDLWNIFKKSHLWPYVKWALLWINMAENRNYPITYGMKDEKTETISTD
jgi:hypothetical protein